LGWDRSLTSQEHGRMRGKIACLVGFHDWQYLIGHGDLIVRGCPRCQKIADVYPAKRLPGLTQIVSTVPLPADRPLRGLEELRVAVAMLKALARDDLGAVWVLGKHVDQDLLVTSMLRLVIDALFEPASDDLEAYTERAFARLDQSPP
jgi:hypothetical protein